MLDVSDTVLYKNCPGMLNMTCAEIVLINSARELTSLKLERKN